MAGTAQVKVAVRREPGADYPQPPFSPDEVFPEYRFAGQVSPSGNPVYRMARALLRDLGMDRERFGTREWNPLGEIIRPGMKVLIKPNLVLARHPRGKDPICLVTHGSIVRAILDYVYLALQGRGSVVIADSPLQETDFDEVVRLSGIDRIVEFYRKQSELDIRILDLRQVGALKDERGHVRKWRRLAGDPEGYVELDLDGSSLLVPLEDQSRRFRVANYPADETSKYHGPGRHRYVIARTVLQSDVIVSLPKMKTHCKAGITLGLKNFVGIVGRKECLAHHRKGSPVVGGDEYPRPNVLKALSDRLERMIDGNPHEVQRRILQALYRANERALRILGDDGLRDGSWHGNDTVWRMVLDLNHIARYATADGCMSDEPQRQIFWLVDGIVAGEGEGPLEPDPMRAGVVAAGTDPVALDIVLATIMGFDWTKIPLLRHAALAVDLRIGMRMNQEADAMRLPLWFNGGRVRLGDLIRNPPMPYFRPPRGWKGFIELASGSSYAVGSERD